jgi:acetylornithine deacetylase/succinyl-diaminopimelate desuccinylase-like protein
VLLGPGSILVAHKPDEHLPLEHLAAGRRLLERLVATSLQGSETIA